MLLTVAATRAEGPGATEKNDKKRCWLQTELLEDRVSGLASLLVGTFVDIFEICRLKCVSDMRVKIAISV